MIPRYPPAPLYLTKTDDEPISFPPMGNGADLIQQILRTILLTRVNGLIIIALIWSPWIVVGRLDH
jgi:hypothetical protein